MLKLFRFLKGKALWSLVIALILMILSSVFNLFQPLFLMDEISVVSVLTDTTHSVTISVMWFVISYDNAWIFFWTLCILMFVFAVLGFACGLFSYWHSAKVSLLVAQNIRNSMYARMLSYSFSQLDLISPASAIVRLTNDVQKVQWYLWMFIGVMLQSLILMVGGGIVAFSLRWELGTVVLVMIGIIVILIAAMGRKSMPSFHYSQISLDDVSVLMRENVLGAKVVKSFGLQQDQVDKFNFVNKRAQRFTFRAYSWIMPIMQMINFGLNFGINLLMLIAGVIIKNGDQKPGFTSEIYGIVQIMVMVLSSSVMVIMVVSIYFRISPSIKRVNEIFAINPEIRNVKKPLKFPKNYEIKFENVSLSYHSVSEKEVLSNLNFTIKQGTSLGIIGATGSGKTSLVSLITRLYDATKGKITIGKVNVKNINLNDLKDNIRVALQEQILFAGNIEYNLRYAMADASRDVMRKAAEMSCAWEFISKLPKTFQSAVEQRGGNFSGGQKQRLCLARSLIGNPKILILDDTTSALDLITEKKVLNNIMTSLPNATKIIVSQRIASIKECDQIIVLDYGKISGIGTHEELLKSNDLYRSISESQLKVVDYE
ncbi:MAG: ABC transporter, ATPase and permease components [Candidatus Malacoplasma girerdii]|nr:MAG: ABC transporter, ATPase and permease components [Candidatus Malacoplasma girerdii]